MSGLPEQASVIVIGAGMVGNSMAYHLGRLGWRDVVLLDKGPLPSSGGSTGHASNFIYLVDHSKEMTRFTVESVAQYKELGVFTESGGIEVARTPERVEELKRRIASAKSWGVEPVELLTREEVRQLVPFINRQFLSAQAKDIVACDFLTVETVYLKTLCVLVFMHIQTRRILGVGVSANPNGTWVTQQARNLMMDLDHDPELCMHFVLRDRDAKYCRSFDAVFGTESIEIVLTPYRTPQANRHIERLIGGLRREVLDRVLILGRRHLSYVLREYAAHHNSHRPHRGLGLRRPHDVGEPIPGPGQRGARRTSVARSSVD